MDGPIHSDTRPDVAVLIPEAMRARICPKPVMEALAAFAHPVIPTDAELAGSNLQDRLKGVTAVITGWRSPPIPRAALAPEGSVAFVSHAAGSVKPLGVLDALESGHVRVSHAAPVIAHAVAEFTLAQILAHLRRHREMDAGLRSGTPWFDLRDTNLGQLLGAQDVGIVGLGYVGRLVLELLRPFGCTVCVCDPFIGEAQAAELDVTLMSLEALFDRCSVVSLHAANLPATEGMITRKHLDLLPEGGLLVNTARAGLIEPGAMLAALQTGRIHAALDAFDIEPLPEEDALRALPNVYLSPHCAGHTRESYVRQGLSAVEEVRRHLGGLPGRQEILREKAAALA
ncbi:hydroxyacid dehydrogenase [Tropicimonas sediminicola]|uniref:Phosphoglycerate dehydrogenase n=1 Tax=Tropicimonas sediminicola TaxID=1031541 RepID=A0A239LAH1_9RHOB|nr:hydroxyacid dehydrogenase [Tropicimonas sediminicola]SNT27461.1 Phosphoglycerate dehydrogenase [Tropicimonas sediminicola]